MNTLQNNDMELVTLEELCYILSIGKNRAYELLKKKAIKSFKIGKVWKIPRAAINQFIIEQAKL